MFFQFGDLQSHRHTQFNTEGNYIVKSNTFWLDVREGSANCDVPSIKIIGKEWYKKIHGT